METLAPSPNMIAQLRGVRNTLREAVLNAENLEYKLIGPRPNDAQRGEPPKTADSVAQILGDIERLSLQLLKATTRPHEILGDFAPKDCAEERPARYA